jgi:hypothetical protein
MAETDFIHHITFIFTGSLFKPCRLFLSPLKYPEEHGILNLHPPPTQSRTYCSLIHSVTFSFCKMNPGHIQLIFVICCMKQLVQNDVSHFPEHSHYDQVWPPHNPDINPCSFFLSGICNALGQKRSDG